MTSNSPSDSYWGTYHGSSRLSFSTKIPPSLDGYFSQETLDYLVLKQRLSEVSRKLDTARYTGEPVPRRIQFAELYDESGKSLSGTSDETYSRLQLERTMIAEAALPQNIIYIKVFAYFILISSYPSYSFKDLPKILPV